MIHAAGRSRALSVSCVCRDNHFVRCSCAAQSVIRQAAIAQGGWRGIVSSKKRSAHLSVEKCVPVVKLLFNCSSKFKI